MATNSRPPVYRLQIMVTEVVTMVTKIATMVTTILMTATGKTTMVRRTEMAIHQKQPEYQYKKNSNLHGICNYKKTTVAQYSLQVAVYCYYSRLILWFDIGSLKLLGHLIIHTLGKVSHGHGSLLATTLFAHANKALFPLFLANNDHIGDTF